tara:strand:- start:1338 stop:1454 length:117 start_codon:yes stop_codon:yes gene_type:complete
MVSEVVCEEEKFENAIDGSSTKKKQCRMWNRVLKVDQR